MLTRAIVLCLVLLPAAAAAQLYTDAELESARRQIGPVTEMLTRDIPATLPRAQRAAAAAIRPEFPDRVDSHPLNMFAIPASATVVIPLETLRFLDDYAILLAWDNLRGCESGYIDTYLYALLREGRRLPPPLRAFGLDRDAALADPGIDDLSMKILKSQVFFLLAHEIGHILLDHDPTATGAASRAQELEADAFALEAFAAIGTAPSGMATWFYATRYLDPTGAEVEYTTHPVFSARLAAFADRLAADPAAFSHSEPDFEAAQQRVAAVVDELRRLADLGDDDDMLDLLPQALLSEFPVSGLVTACSR